MAKPTALVSVVLLFARSTLADVPIGLAAAGANQRCVAFPDASLSAGTPITLVFADTPQRVVRARIGRMVDECAPLEGADVSGPYFELIDLNSVVDIPWVAISILSVGRVDSAGRASADVDGRKPLETFRLCSSTEGLHLTVWSGRPLRGKLLWHAYFYLGYDVEPTCSSRDISEPDA